MLNSIHFLLSYKCTSECDHCFLYCSPQAEGTFTLAKLRQVFNEIRKVKPITGVYFEGGEPFLFYPLMIEGIRIARSMGLTVGVVTNAYWATSVEDAVIWLKPLAELGISDLSLSDDLFHHDDIEMSPAKIALAAATKLGIPADTICIEAPETASPDDTQAKGEPITKGGVKFRGRAVEKLSEGIPRQSWKNLTTCPHEDLEKPERVHLDAFGNVHLCQGLLMGNVWKTPLTGLIRSYNPHTHPICGPLLKGGPVLLAKEYGIDLEPEYIEECHLCYLVRRALIARFPDLLGPAQVYGLDTE
ncbi:MAG: hypothetical protein NT028_10590 [candidate division Zixibacteria bacterium]|nr:hypothetical protein [candidate division Zixibacteria bacterium]